jgi:phosphoglycerate dehydrogenase-like enzyme
VSHALNVAHVATTAAGQHSDRMTSPTSTGLAVAAQPDVIRRLGEEAVPWLRLVEFRAGDEAPDGPVDMWVPEYPASLGPRAWAAGLAALPGLRVVQLLSAGVDPWPALIADSAGDPVLCNGRGIHGASTAELAVATTLAMVRELPRYVRQQEQRHWRGSTARSVAGARVLVLGAGDIGRRVADVLRMLDARVTLVARTARDGVVAMADLPDLLPRQEIVVIAVPSTPETERMVGRDFLAALPDGALVVNVARGRVVDTAALLAELTSERLYAALDVVDPEPLPADHPLWVAPRVLITPHVGGGAEGWLERGCALVLDQAGRLQGGEELCNRVVDGY